MGPLLTTLYAVIAKIFANEIQAWLPRISERFTDAAVRTLDENQRERYDEEWRGHLNEVPGDLARAWLACGFLLAAWKISKARKLKRLWSQIAAVLMLGILGPLILIIALLIKFSSPGPVFYRFRHVNADGDVLWLYTFRVWAPIPLELLLRFASDESWFDHSANIHYSLWRTPTTWIGRLLVHSGLESLPLLINTVLGEIELGAILSADDPEL